MGIVETLVMIGSMALLAAILVPVIFGLADGPPSMVSTKRKVNIKVKQFPENGRPEPQPMPKNR